MAHARKQLRDLVRDLLLGISETGDRVFIGKARPLPAAHEPTILIYSPIEEASRDAFPVLARALTLFVEIRMSTAAEADDELDSVAGAVETRMAHDITQGGRVRNTQYIGVQQAVDAEGKAILSGLRMEYRVTYRTVEGQPDAFV